MYNIGLLPFNVSLLRCKRNPVYSYESTYRLPQFTNMLSRSDMLGYVNISFSMICSVCYVIFVKNIKKSMSFVKRVCIFKTYFFWILYEYNYYKFFFRLHKCFEHLTDQLYFQATSKDIEKSIDMRNVGAFHSLQVNAIITSIYFAYV